MYKSLIRVIANSLGAFVRGEAIKNEFLVTLVFFGIGFAMCMGFSLTDMAFAGMIEYRSIDGTNNNLIHPDWGSTETPLWRVGNVYADGLSIPAGITRPSAREISNIVVSQIESILNDKRASDFIWQWGQFVDHDIDLTTTAVPSEPFNIPVPTGDPFFDPTGTGTQFIPFERSMYVNLPVREQLNLITSFIDASNVYGSDPIRAAWLRTFVGGKLKTSPGEFLPYNTAGLPNAGGTSNTLFLAGDIRANEQIALTAMHTLFVREHNRLADMLAKRYPDLSDEELYQWARKMVGAEVQIITYYEYLPALLGPNALPEYKGYNPELNPAIANEFATVSFRYGHSALSSQLIRPGYPDVVLRDAFFNPGLVTIDGGIDSILHGMMTQRAQEVDVKVIDDVRNFLFGPAGAGGFDLASLNIQRGRDHGLMDYNSMRVAYGLPQVTSFAEITSDPELQLKLKFAYGSVDAIDAWIGGLAEDHVPNGLVGELIRTVLADQFLSLRDGDRFWYENDAFFKENKDLRRYLEKTKLSDIIQLNTDLEEIHQNVFFVHGDLK